MQEMHQVFDRSKLGHDAGREILSLRQGGGLVSDYTIEFQTLATDSGWEVRALVDSFIHGLSERVKYELLTQELPEDLDQLISLTIGIDSWLEDHTATPDPNLHPGSPGADPGSHHLLISYLQGEALGQSLSSWW